MGKNSSKENLKVQLKAENPTLTDEQLDDLIAESGFVSSDFDESKKNNTIDDFKKELEKEKAAFEEEKAAFEKEKAEFLKSKKEEQEAAVLKTETITRSYKCVVRCTFNGTYYREGDVMTSTSDDVPEFFVAL